MNSVQVSGVKVKFLFWPSSWENRPADDIDMAAIILWHHSKLRSHAAVFKDLKSYKKKRKSNKLSFHLFLIAQQLRRQQIVKITFQDKSTYLMTVSFQPFVS